MNQIAKYAKSTAAAGVLTLVLLVLGILIIYRPFGDRAIDIGSVIGDPATWIAIVLVFAAGFYWTLQRLNRKP
jgi:hypothetical protein